MNSKIVIYINGKHVKADKAFILVQSEGFLFGAAVFETLRTYHGKLFRLKDHLKRLKESALIIGLKSPWTMKAIEAIVNPLSDQKPWPEFKVRMILTGEDFILMAEELKEKSKKMYEEGVKLITVEGERNLAQSKNLGDTLCHVANQKAKKAGAYDALLVNPQGMVRECAYANLFWVKNGQLFTNNQKILRGITRETVIELSGNCEFKEISYQALLKADEIFLTQTSSGILPVVEIEAHRIGTGKPGKMTTALMAKFQHETWGDSQAER